MPAGKPPRIIELEDERNALSRSATAAEAEPCLSKHLSLVYRANALRLSSADIFRAEKRKPSSSTKTIGLQSGKVMRGRENEKFLSAALRPLPKAEVVIDRTPMVSAALLLEAESTYEKMRVAVKKFCFV